MRELAGLTQRQTAEKTGLSDGYVSLLEADRRKASPAAIKLLSAAFGVREGWLLTGEGSMRDRRMPESAQSPLELPLTSGGAHARLMTFLDPELAAAVEEVPLAYRSQYLEKAREIRERTERKLQSRLQELTEDVQRELTAVRVQLRTAWEADQAKRPGRMRKMRRRVVSPNER